MTWCVCRSTVAAATTTIAKEKNQQLPIALRKKRHLITIVAVVLPFLRQS